ncbi:MAG TPA: FAD-dependent thymidylate synthase [Candidatus Babeliales bacterium]|nr:FAD-dependent thymidylate synthase [Candidatus Babeliales bacterium]
MELNQELVKKAGLSNVASAPGLGLKLDPLGDQISSLELVRLSGTDIDVVNAARVSFGKFVTNLEERDAKLIDYLMKHNHSSPFEHNQLSFRVKAPLFVARQWLRHRMNSYNEISYRYVEAPIEFYTPVYWRHQDSNNRQASNGAFQDHDLAVQYREAIEQAVQTYQKLLAGGVCREQARAILPVCLYTQFIFTCNLRSLTHFLQLRLAAGAQQEIQAYAAGLLQLAEPHFPVSLKAWRKYFYSERAR